VCSRSNKCLPTEFLNCRMFIYLGPNKSHAGKHWSSLKLSCSSAEVSCHHQLLIQFNSNYKYFEYRLRTKDASRNNKNSRDTFQIICTNTHTIKRACIYRYIQNVDHYKVYLSAKDVPSRHLIPFIQYSEHLRKSV
jgi:hypothetical protein